MFNLKSIAFIALLGLSCTSTKQDKSADSTANAGAEDWGEEVGMDVVQPPSAVFSGFISAESEGRVVKVSTTVTSRIKGEVEATLRIADDDAKNAVISLDGERVLLHDEEANLSRTLEVKRWQPQTAEWHLKMLAPGNYRFVVDLVVVNTDQSEKPVPPYGYLQYGDSLLIPSYSSQWTYSDLK